MRKESEESELEPGEVIACRYRVEAHCRTHPLGELYRCCDLSGAPAGAASIVLLQRLRREFALPSVQDRLFETRGSASLESPVIADILDYGEDIDGRPFLVTAWSDDASLDAVERPLGFVEATAIVIRVAEALAPLHARGLLHGGVEPASVLVDDQRELTALLGFGLAPALAAGADRTRALPLLVSPGYAAPELITGQPLGPQADVYALGILLWELIFAQVPFRGPTLRVLDAHLNRPLPDVELPFDAPASFERTLRRMLDKRPEHRFADAGAVAEQLRGHLCEPTIFQPTVLEPTAIVSRQDMLEHEDDDDKTVVFKAVPQWVNVSRAPPYREFVPAQPTQSHRLAPFVVVPAPIVPTPMVPTPMVPTPIVPTPIVSSPIVPARIVASGVGVKLAVALAMCVSLVLLSVWAVGRDRTRVATEQSNGVGVEHALASAIQLGPIAVEAVSRVRQPLPEPVEPVVAPPPLVQLDASSFRAQKDELVAGIERICTQGDVRRTVKLAVRVDGRGRVQTANVRGKMGATKLGRCVERQALGLAFPTSREGGYYAYTLRLRR